MHRCDRVYLKLGSVCRRQKFLIYGSMICTKMTDNLHQAVGRSVLRSLLQNSLSRISTTVSMTKTYV